MRQLIDAASKISAIGYADNEDVDVSIRQAEDLIFKITNDKYIINVIQKNIYLFYGVIIAGPVIYIVSKSL